MMKNGISDLNKQTEIVTTNIYDEHYLCMFTLRSKPVSMAFIEKLAMELILWADKDPDALKISQFNTKKGITSQDMDRWCKRSEKLAFATAHALQMIGDRREIGGLKKKLDSSMVTTSMPMYDKAWEKLYEWKAGLTKKVEGPSTITVEMKSVEDSPLVAERKKDDSEPVL